MTKPEESQLLTSTLDEFSGQSDVRRILADHMGQVITPEIAASLEIACRKASEPLSEKIKRLGEKLVSLPPVDCPIRHYFADGLFAREIRIKKGVTVLGVVHKAESVIVVSKGRLVAATESGPKTYKAGDTMVCKPGMQNAVTALEDSIWTNFYPNPDNETSIEVLAERYTESTLSQLLGGKDNVQRLNFLQNSRLEV